MMKLCKSCCWYDEEQDGLTQSCEDCIFVAEGDPRYGEHHYCAVYNEFEIGIPKPIMRDEVKCKHFFSKEEQKRIRAGIK